MSYRYRHKNQNSIYYLKPRSTDIYILDFKNKGFRKEKLESASLIPKAFTSVQTISGHIYIVGGIAQSGAYCRNLMRVDPNLKLEEREPMKMPRAAAPVALVRDQFLFVCGGLVDKKKSTN